ncbi:unnamed protein product [Meganyctiphanes norvegica]|uniref:KICSTOR subunit 2 n=1 Tax=Meganyctiphanes norvegica TaxID=48144 RepID=A0AAV2PU61_MEGNR
MTTVGRYSTDQEEAVLQNLFTQFSNFAYDKAKENAEKERDNSRSSGSAVWHLLLSSVAQLAIAEKLYMNLDFLTTKGFLRKESSVRATFESLLSDLSDVEKKRMVLISPMTSTGALGSPSSDGVLLHLCSHLALYVQARIHMIGFYEKVVSMALGRLMNFEELLNQVTDISTSNSRHFHHPIFTAIKTSFTYECDILQHLLGSQVEMQLWRFLPALLHLHDAHSKLTSWHTTGQTRESKKYGFGSSFLKSSPLPSLYKWLCQVKEASVSKFSLYFHETLLAQSSPTEMKGLMARQTCDYVAKIQSFQRRSDAASVCLVFEAAGVDDYRGAGYHHPAEPAQPPKGLDSYPAIFSYPPLKSVERWPSIVMRVSDRTSEPALLDRVVHFFDQQIGSTYFLCRVESRITIVVIFDCKKSEKDNHIKDFIYDLALQLRCNKVFANLKPK